MTSVNAYTRFVTQMGRISAHTPTAKTPPLLNAHLVVKSPFPSLKRADEDPASFELRRKAQLFYASTPSESQAKVTQILNAQKLGIELEDVPGALRNTKKDAGKAFLTDIPLPAVIRRHIHNPSLLYASQSSLGKVMGFRIETNGKRGTRSGRQVVQYGRLATSDSHNSMVDFGRSFYFNKKGAMGIKVWVGYSA
ncbi:hypothetical protein BC830DRAFT_1156362 [Chytriomyces sp. MP71]|nr:hypothetical protein BC830DRAFT_1156362 [Chytriomyces sp. MP71]